MRVLVKGVHVRVSQRLRGYIEEHLVAALARFYDDSAIELSVYLVDVNGNKGGVDKECRVTMRLPGARPIHVTEAADSLYKSIDIARDRLERVAKRELARRRTPVKLRKSARNPLPLGGEVGEGRLAEGI